MVLVTILNKVLMTLTVNKHYSGTKLSLKLQQHHYQNLMLMIGCWCGGGGDTFKYKRYFSHFSDGKIYCFKDGATSFSAERTLVTAWDNFEIYTGE